MNSADMVSLVPNADDLLTLTREQQGKLLLELLVKQHNTPQTAVSHANFFNRAGDSTFGPGTQPKYGYRQPEVDEALMEAWTWADSQGLLTKSPSSAGNWVYVGKSGKEFLTRTASLDEIEELLRKTPQGRREAAWWSRARSVVERWNPAKSAEAKAAEDLFFANFQALRRGADDRRRGENQLLALLNQAKHEVGRLRGGTVQPRDFTLIAESRLDELRALTSSQFDFRKLIRLCEELNIASREDCYFSIGMLTRGLLDHVPPVFGVKSFGEVANNYVGGSKSFKDTMLHLDTAAKKIADGLLHTQIRKSETLPTALQVNFAPALDLLLGEIVRICQ